MDLRHWNKIYQNKSDKEVSWFQDVPTESLQFIDELNLDFDDNIIDIGAGNSRLVDTLFDRGFRHLSILDISTFANEKARVRLGDKANSIKFITSDVTKFSPAEKYKLWHDRATFHFLTTTEEVEKYLNVAQQAIMSGGFLMISTFSKTGPKKCSGLPITQYSDSDLKAIFQEHFSSIRCFENQHRTPWGTTQDFVYCGFKRR